MPLCSGIERLWRVSGEVLRRGVWHRRREALPRERDDSDRPARQLALLDPSAAVLGAVRRRRWYAYIHTYIHTWISIFNSSFYCALLPEKMGSHEFRSRWICSSIWLPSRPYGSQVRSPVHWWFLTSPPLSLLLATVIYVYLSHLPRWYYRDIMIARYSITHSNLSLGLFSS